MRENVGLPNTECWLKSISKMCLITYCIRLLKVNVVCLSSRRNVIDVVKPTKPEKRRYFFYCIMNFPPIENSWHCLWSHPNQFIPFHSSPSFARNFQRGHFLDILELPGVESFFWRSNYMALRHAGVHWFNINVLGIQRSTNGITQDQHILQDNVLYTHEIEKWKQNMTGNTKLLILNAYK